MEYGFAIGGGWGGSSIEVIAVAIIAVLVVGVVVVMIAVGMAVVAAVVAVVIMAAVVVAVVAIEVTVARAVVAVVSVVVVDDAGAVVDGSCCDWVMKIRRGMISEMRRGEGGGYCCWRRGERDGGDCLLTKMAAK